MMMFIAELVADEFAQLMMPVMILGESAELPGQLSEVSADALTRAAEGFEVLVERFQQRGNYHVEVR